MRTDPHMSSSQSSTCPIHRHAQARPSALALWSRNRRWTYAELDAAVGATRARLRANGVQGGMRVALRLMRRPTYVLLLWALWREGAVAVPLSTRLPAEEAQHAAHRAGVALLITSESALLEETEDALKPRPPDPFAIHSGQDTPSPPNPPLDRPATVLFTSGSTGTPKAVLHTWANHLYSAKGSNANLPLRPRDRWLLSLPLYHVGGIAILVRCALAGAAVAIPGHDTPVAKALKTAGATHASLVAIQLRRLLDATEGASPNRRRALLLGGGPLPESLLRRGHARGWPLHTSYGSTEMASQITTTSPGASLDDLRTAGRCLSHRRLRVDEDGQILVSGPTLCAGFVEEEGLRDPRVDGWYPTGDVGRLDASGRLHVEGRVDRQFVSGGENIQPEEIEAALEQLKEVRRAVVVSIPDEEYGRRPVGFVRTKQGALPPEWASALEATLPPFKIPDELLRLPEAVTSTASGMKIDYDRLRQKAQGEGGEKRTSSSAKE